jgi:hypothetical protein
MDEVGWIVTGVLVFFGMLIGSCVYGETQQHERQMKCMELRGEWIGGKTCIFREQPAK